MNARKDMFRLHVGEHTANSLTEEDFKVGIFCVFSSISFSFCSPHLQIVHHSNIFFVVAVVVFMASISLILHSGCIVSQNALPIKLHNATILSISIIFFAYPILEHAIMSYANRCVSQTYASAYLLCHGIY